MFFGGLVPSVSLSLPQLPIALAGATRQYAAAAALPSRALRGLYGGKEVQFGNKVSKDGGNKTRRKWKPNVVSKNLYSDILEKKFKLKVTTYVLRCIKKHGSLDNYLLNTNVKNIRSDVGLELKKRVELALRAQREGMAGQVAQTEAVDETLAGSPTQNGA